VISTTTMSPDSADDDCPEGTCTSAITRRSNGTT
jgi:hypothetical protein